MVVPCLVLVCTALASTSTSSTTTTTRPPQVPDTVDATGKADVTASLQAYVNSVPDGGTVRLQSGGTYRIEGTLVLNNRRNLTVDGNGARLFATTLGSQSRSQLNLYGGSGIVIHDLSITGANAYAGTDERAYQPAQAFQHGIRIAGATDVEITRVRISATYGDFVYLGRGDGDSWSERIWVHDSQFAGSGRQGIAIAAGRDVVIERNSITNTRRATIDLEPNGETWGAENVHIIDNVVGPGRLLFVAAAGAGPVDRVVVARNFLSGRSLTMVVSPPKGMRYSNFYVVDNQTNIPVHRPPLAFTAVNSLVVTGNDVPIDLAGIPAVLTTNVCGITVAGNNPGPAGVELTVGPPVCDAPGPAANVPPPPAVAGRPVSAAPPPTTSTTRASSTTSTTRKRSDTPVPAASGPTGSGDNGTGTALVVALVFLVIAGSGTWFFLRRSARQRAERKAASRSA